MNRDSNERRHIVLRTTAQVLALIGAVCSIDLTMLAARHNHSFLLKAMFFIWALSPFIGLVFGIMASKRWNNSSRSIIYILTFIITVLSVMLYSRTILIYSSKPAFVFLAMPLISWVLILVVMVASGLSTKRFTHSPIV